MEYEVLLSLALCGLGVLLALYTYSLKAHIKTLKEQLKAEQSQFENTLHSTNHAAAAMGRRIRELEGRLVHIRTSVEEIKHNDVNKVSYSEAARLVEMGASTEDLMDACMISRPEAELISSLVDKNLSKAPILSTDHMV